MIVPDLLGCGRHDASEMSKVRDHTQGYRWYCRACRREKEASRHYNELRCYKRGHLKTPWSWRIYSGVGRCTECVKIARRLQKAS